MNKIKVLLVILTVAVVAGVPFAPYVYAQEGWIRPTLIVQEQYDDNIFLTDTDEKSDWITIVSPGLVIEPTLNKHEFTFDYRADLKYFDTYDKEDSYSHTADAALQLNFNKFNLNVDNRLRYFDDQVGGEETKRLSRTQDEASIRATFDSAGMDLSFGYIYRLQDYRSSDAIGDFKGQSLNYRDLDTDEHTGELELALKLWPKTSLLFSGDYGTLTHETGKKSDSAYFDVLVGLRGEPTAKSTVEAKVGYRSQDYEDYSDDFESVVFNGSLIEIFTSRDTLRLDFVRTSNGTNYKDNAYYETTFIAANFEHGFTDRFLGSVNFSYQLNDYPTSTTEAGKTAEREDDFWVGGVGFSYEMPVGAVVDVKYQYRMRDSVFSTFDYRNSRVTFGLAISF